MQNARFTQRMSAGALETKKTASGAISITGHISPIFIPEGVRILGAGTDGRSPVLAREGIRSQLFAARHFPLNVQRFLQT